MERYTVHHEYLMPYEHGNVVLYADAQATVEALQREVNTLNQLLRDKGLGQGEIDGMAAEHDELQALRDERDRLARAIVWALGYTDFRAREHGEGPYWWRTELRLRAKLTGEQIDAILAALTPAGGGQE